MDLFENLQTLKKSKSNEVVKEAYENNKKESNEVLSSVQVNEKIEYIKDALDALKSFADKEVNIPSTIGNSLSQIYSLADSIYEYVETTVESTSSIGGAYTKKAIDVIPGKTKKINETIESKIGKNYLQQIENETSKFELVRILHKMRDNKGVPANERKELEDAIRNKVWDKTESEE